MFLAFQAAVKPQRSILPLFWVGMQGWGAAGESQGWGFRRTILSNWIEGFIAW
jgi:hypothetical protein